MKTKIPIVNTAQNANTAHSITPPTDDSDLSPVCNTIVHSTSDNSRQNQNISLNLCRYNTYSPIFLSQKYEIKRK